jgi:O-antigen/teichoic acid export membrane protein
LNLRDTIRRHFAASTFLGSAGIYFAGSLINGLLPLALVPVFTRYLTPEDYGIVATCMVLMNIFIIFQGLNSYGLITRGHFDGNFPAQRRLVSTSILMTTAITGALLILCLTPLRLRLGEWAEFPASWLPGVLFLGFFSVLQNNYQVLLQARKEPWHFIGNQTLGSFLNMGLSLWLVVGMGWAWQGRLFGLLLGGAAISVVCLWGFIRRLGLLRVEFSKQSLHEIFSFGIPLIPHVLGGWVMTMSARLYLNNMASVADTGLFSLAFNLTSPVNMVIGALSRTYRPWLFEKLGNPNELDEVALCRQLLLASASILFAGLIFGIGVALVLPFIVGAKFLGAAPYVFWLSLTMAFSGVYFIFGNFVVYSKRTSLMAWRADFLGGIVVLISCPIFIHIFGPVGAAVSNCLGYVATTIGCITAARIAHPMPWGRALKSILWKATG